MELKFRDVFICHEKNFWEKKMKLVKVTSLIMGLALVAGCEQIPMTLSTSQEVKLRISSSPQKLEVFSPGSSKCRRPNKGPGCIHVAEHEIAVISFRLLQSAKWHLTKLEICKFIKKDDKKADRDCDLDDWERLEFAASNGNVSDFRIPNESGVIDLIGLDTDLHEFQLYDQNSFEQEYFYRVRACKDSDFSDCLWTDPPIENGGRR